MSKVNIADNGTATVRFDDGVIYSFASGITPRQRQSGQWHYYDTHASGKKAMPNVETMGASMMGYAVVHWYKYFFEVQDVWMGLRDYPALEYTNFGKEDFGDPVSTGDTTNVELFGPVTHIVDSDKRVLVNKTTPTHTLHNGFVVRHVWSEGPKVYVQSIGFGVGQYARANEIPSGVVWGSVSMKTIRSMAVKYYERRTGKKGIVMENNPRYNDIPDVVN
jgi:hypothetical protein